ncbi:MAG: helix-turn-helix domain-containing protein [Deltaproteobacteria bacterium]|nr:helix-turn-helix domain-containing protein [Deltaproteobacteria bacterium]
MDVVGARPAGTGPLLLDVAEVAAALGVGRTFVYGLLARGELESCKLGSRTKVPPASVRAYVARLLAEQEAERAEVAESLARRRRR